MSSSTATRVLYIVIGLVLAGIAALIAWTVLGGGKAIAEDEAQIATSAPAAGHRAAMESDLHNLVITMQTSVVDTGALPSLALQGGAYVVTDENGTAVTVPASDGVSATALSGTSETDFCVALTAADGTTLHAGASGTVADGGC